MKNVVVVLLALYLMLVLGMYLLQRTMMYFPSSEPTNSVYEVINVESAGLTLKVVTNTSQLKPAVIYFGGNGEDVYAAADRMQSAFIGRAAYYVNYPGYGGSAGSPTETSITQAAKDVYQYVSAKHRSVALVGRSLGTGVAVKLASEKSVSHLVLISPYDSVASVAMTHYPFFPIWLIKDKFDSRSLVANISAKTLIILANDDEVIPIEHSYNLIKAFKNITPQVKVYDQADHNNVHLQDGFMTIIRRFLANEYFSTYGIIN